MFPLFMKNTMKAQINKLFVNAINILFTDVSEKIWPESHLRHFVHARKQRKITKIICKSCRPAQR